MNSQCKNSHRGGLHSHWERQQGHLPSPNVPLTSAPPPPHIPSSPSDRDRQGKSVFPDTLTAFRCEALSCPETRCDVCSKAAQFIVVALLSVRLQGETEQILENIGLSAGCNTAGWITQKWLVALRGCNSRGSQIKMNLLFTQRNN